MCTVCMMTQTFDPARHPNGDPVFSAITEGSDAAETTNTAYTISVGDTFNGTISSISDEDWVRISLTEGETYSISLDGLTLSDPLVRIYDASGRELARNDDANESLDSELIFTASSSGTYYIEADAFSFETGTYRLSVTETAPPKPVAEGSLDDLALQLTEGFWGGSELTFNTSTSNEITVNLDGLTAAGQQLARWAMEAWEMVVDLDFVEVANGEMITMDDEDGGAFAYAPNTGSTSILDGDRTTGVELNVAESWLDDNGTTLDSYSFLTYVHEIGHAIGLGHQGNYNGNASYGRDNAFLNDSWQLSVMSYFSQTENTDINAAFAYPAGAMMADILAIQNLYGAPDANSATAGATTYGEGSNLGNYLDEVFDWLATGATSANLDGNLMAFTVYDRDGEDTFEFGFLTSAARLDMRDAQLSDLAGFNGILGIARGTMIENAVLGTGNDTVTGNVADNIITAGAGNDSINGSQGADILLGQNGADHLDGGLDADSVIGGNGDDMILGGSGFDTLRGGNGDDTVVGGNGRDSVFLGGGDDLFVDNTQGGANGADTVLANGGNDTIGGGAGNDRFEGQDGSDLLLGRLGNDVLFGGNQNDTLEGGDGNDIVAGGNGVDHGFLGNGDDRWFDNDQVQFG
ncbi:M10 family metallopeptidase C-terminal domain-containing protein, partial [Tateyamaria sp.]|uniref:M10 family metallopeptidase C-terminal domain-containing protein n=1 Tax=Tateyamaria sp. TaxID=1929288 RepID=UPI00329D3965